MTKPSEAAFAAEVPDTMEKLRPLLKSRPQSLSFQEVVEEWLMVDGKYIHMLAKPDLQAMCPCCIGLFLCLVLHPELGAEGDIQTAKTRE